MQLNGNFKMDFLSEEIGVQGILIKCGAIWPFSCGGLEEWIGWMPLTTKKRRGRLTNPVTRPILIPAHRTTLKLQECRHDYSGFEPMKGFLITGVPGEPHDKEGCSNCRSAPTRSYKKGHMPLIGVSKPYWKGPTFAPMPLEIAIAFDFDTVIEMKCIDVVFCMSFLNTNNDKLIDTDPH